MVQIFKDRFVELIQKTGVTPYQISKDTGISNSALSSWKRGEKVPSAQNIKKLAEYFSVPVDFLMDNQSKNNVTYENADIEKLVLDYQSLSEQGKEYIRQQMVIASQIYKKAALDTDVENIG